MECHSQLHSANSFQAYDLNGTGVRVAVQRKRSDWSRLVAQWLSIRRQTVESDNVVFR